MTTPDRNSRLGKTAIKLAPSDSPSDDKIIYEGSVEDFVIAASRT
jgi:hypothetical protein